MTLAEKINQFIADEAIRTQSPKIHLGTLNEFICKVGFERDRQTSKRFKKQMKKLLKDRMIFDYAGEGLQSAKIHIVPKNRILRALQNCVHLILSSLCTVYCKAKS